MINNTTSYFGEQVEETLPVYGPEVVEPLDVLSTRPRNIPSFITKVYPISSNVKLLPDLTKVWNSCYILQGDEEVLLSTKK